MPSLEIPRTDQIRLWANGLYRMLRTRKICPPVPRTIVRVEPAGIIRIATAAAVQQAPVWLHSSWWALP